MLEIHHRLGLEGPAPDFVLVLSHEQRQRGRMLLQTQCGEEVRLFLKRGQALLVGEYLQSLCGKIVQVQGATEELASARSDDWQTFARACYHLGNRHVKIEVGELVLQIKPDHVLEEMLQLMGLQLSYRQDIFAPESGAYQHAHH
jgi:urease accessory protein